MSLTNLEIIIRLSVEDYGGDTKGLQFYKQYINHLKSQMVNSKKLGVDKSQPYRDFEGYQDHLQHPLQPLHDHLESTGGMLSFVTESLISIDENSSIIFVLYITTTLPKTYEVFERDPVKYQLYESAMSEAIRDTLSKQDRTVQDPFTMVVAGAGRGPLVQRAVHAANMNNLENCKIIVIEKNPAAFLTLKQRYHQVWGRHKNLENVPKYEMEPKGVISESLLLKVWRSSCFR